MDLIIMLTRVTFLACMRSDFPCTYQLAIHTYVSYMHEACSASMVNRTCISLAWLVEIGVMHGY